MSTASAIQRQQSIEELQSKEYDLLVIGGVLQDVVLHLMQLPAVYL